MYELPSYSRSYNGTAYVVDDREIRVLFPLGANRPNWLRVPLSFIISESRGLVPQGVKQRVPQTNSSPSSSEILECWSYTSTPPHVLMALCLIN
jgi:hypothetical protein